LNPTVGNGMVFDWERIQQVLTIHNSMPTTRTPNVKKASSGLPRQVLRRIGWSSPSRF
jgi:hypothetical protein